MEISMPGSGLKSASRHPYQLKKFPFWRYTPKGMYSDESKEIFERQKESFDQVAKFIQWETRPAIQ